MSGRLPNFHIFVGFKKNIILREDAVCNILTVSNTLIVKAKLKIEEEVNLLPFSETI